MQNQIVKILLHTKEQAKKKRNNLQTTSSSPVYIQELTRAAVQRYPALIPDEEELP